LTVVSFITANFVARELGYPGTDDWPLANATTSERFREAFRDRFGALVRDVREMGFDAVDIWRPHLDVGWATDEHVSSALELLAGEGLSVTSLAGHHGDNEDELEASCKLALAVDAPLLVGSSKLFHNDRAAAVAILERHGITLALENHDSRGAAENAALVDEEPASPRVATAIDTGWYGTFERDPAEAVAILGSRVAHVHLKDIEAPGAHVTTSFGDGCLDLEAVVHALARTGYDGPIAVEHEPFDRDPTDECVASHALLRRWLAEAA
jgi:sugar phosphate isomerase/epimerase